MTTLMEEEPYAAVVDGEVISSTCSKCFDWNSALQERVTLSRCSGCHVVHYCSPKCQKADWKDHKPECKLLRSTNFVPSNTARLVMRMLENSRKEPDFKSFNGRTYDSLMHNSKKRRENDNCMAEARTIYAEICRFMGTKAPNFETFFLALSKKAMNAFPIHDGSWTHNPCGIGLYIGLSVLDHSCRPDAFIVNQGPKMMLRTTKKDLLYSDKLTISYYDGFSVMNTSMRRTKLVSSHLFHCKCDKCEDIESDKKKTAGRPACCPDSWFSTTDLICNNCKQKVSSELANKAEDAMKRLREAIFVFLKTESAFSTPLFEWMELFDSCKEVLSDENTFLFSMMSVIYMTSSFIDMNISCKFADLSLPLARKDPHSVYSAVLFASRLKYYETAQKPLHQTKQALIEAYDSVQVVFGTEHDLTQSLLQKKVFYDFAILDTR